MRFGFALLFGTVSAAAAIGIIACSSSSLPSISDSDDGAPGRADGSSNQNQNGDGGTMNQSDGRANGQEGGGGACTPDPANAEIEGNNCDDDGDGKVDNVATCDDAADGGGGAQELARAIGVCDSAASRGFGLVNAIFTNGYGKTTTPNDYQHGVLPAFGGTIKPREGAALGVISSGYALAFDGLTGTEPFNQGVDWFNYGPADQGKAGNGAAPPGFPKAAPGCDQETIVNDVIDVKLTLKAPPNAYGFAFDFDFWSGDWPTYVCAKYNDAFVAYVSAQGFNNGTPDNIAFDSKGAPIGVNATIFDRCTPNSPVECDLSYDGGNGGPNPHIATCAGGVGELTGTGFSSPGTYCGSTDAGDGGTMAAMTQTGGGATGWHTSRAPVNPGETFTLELFVWDAADAVLDSSVLLDHFHWLATAPVAGTQ